MDPLKELEGFDAGRQLALMKKLGGRSTVDAILRGELNVEVKRAIRKLFDKNGRRIPERFPDHLSFKVCDASREYYLKQPRMETGLDYVDRILRLHKCLGVNTGIIFDHFRNEAERLLSLIRNNPQIANITNGVWLPVILPRFTNDDLGATLHQYFSAAEKSCNRKLRHHYRVAGGGLTGAVKIIDGSRHEQLIKQMKRGPAIGIHFPNSLQGFSINASREQMLTLPEGFVLSGLDTAIALVMYPDILACGRNTPGLSLAAFYWQSVAFVLGCSADEVELFFDYTDDLSNGNALRSNGLLFLG